MPTPQGTAAANAQTTDEAWIILAEFNHQSLTKPVRVARNKENVLHRGETYVRFPFDVALPDESSDRRALGRIEIDDIGEFEDPDTGEMKTIGDIVKAIPVGDNVTVTLTIVLGSDPELIEREPEEFMLRNVRGDEHRITGDLHLEDLMDEPFPCDSMPA